MVRVISRRFDELTTLEFHDLLRLRCDVFVVEQACAYPELDGRDAEPMTEHHWIQVDDGAPIACCARTLTEPDGSVRIGRVATEPAARGRGLAAVLVAALIERFDGSTVVLDAQSHLVDWYTALGFESVGDPFVEDGIPHVSMRLSRTSSR